MKYHRTYLALAAVAAISLSQIAHAQNLFVANSGNNTIVKFSADFSSYSSFANASTGISKPAALAFDSSGNLYVANAGNNTIEKFSADGTQHSVFASVTTGLSDPDALAFDSSGNLYVANYTGTGHDSHGNPTSPMGTIEKFSPNGATYSIFASFISAPQNGDYGVQSPSALAFDSTGNLFVGNYGTDIEKFSPDGSTHSIFASPQTGNDPYATTSSGYTAYGMAFRNGILYFANYDRNNIETVSPDGKTFTEFANSSQGVFAPDSLAFDGAGDLFVASDGNSGSNIREFAPSGASYTTITTSTGGATSYPLAIAFSPAAAPEPSQFAVIGVGFLCLGGLALRGRRRTAVSKWCPD